MTDRNENPQPDNLWRRLADRFRAFGEAMEMSDAEFQSRRMDALEQRLREFESRRSNNQSITSPDI